MKNTILFALVLVSAQNVEGQSRTGSLKVNLINGTTGTAGEAQKVTLFKRGSILLPIATSSDVQGSFVLENLNLDGEETYLLQVTSGGVDYNQTVDLGSGGEVQTSLSIYDVTQDQSCIHVRSGRFLLQRENGLLNVEKLYVVENQCEPRRTYYDSEGTFRFHLPQEVAHGTSVLVSAPGGAPVTEAASPLPDGSGYVIHAPFEPGKTDVIIRYDVADPSGNYQIQERAYYALSQLLVLITPADIELTAEGWENLTPEGPSRYIVLRQSNVDEGSPIEVAIAGNAGSAITPMASVANHPSPHGRVTKMPYQSQFHVGIIVLLMGAALTFGLLYSSLTPIPPKGKDK